MKLTITRPDDWHLHLRDGEALAAVVGHSAAQFSRAIIMPNLTPPVSNNDLAVAYHSRIKAALPQGSNFDPLMTLYLTEQLTGNDIKTAANNGLVKACKLYPAGATTNSDSGVRNIKSIYPLLEAMQKAGLVLCIHGEVVDPAIDIFDREKVFIDRYLVDLSKNFPELSIVMEHITTADAAIFIEQSTSSIAATITPQHLMYNRNDMLVGGIRPHYYCLPILKRNTHRQALIRAATSGNKKFFLGTDSAPHMRSAKENACGCAGVYSAHAALPLYAEIFEAANALDKLEGFASHFGADFYKLQRNSDTITLEKKPWQIPATYDFGDGVLVPMKAGETITWQVS